VEDDQIGLLASHGEVVLFCKACRNLTSWHYPHTDAKRQLRSLATDPLLETFEYRMPEPAQGFPPDPLFVRFESILSDQAIRMRMTEWDWYG